MKELTQKQKDRYIDWFLNVCTNREAELNWLIDELQSNNASDAIDSIKDVADN